MRIPWSVYPYRAVAEELLVLYLIWTGFNILLHDNAMVTAAYDGLLRIAPENSWGIWMIEVAICHAAAMIINGTRWWTPFVRVATAGVVAIFTTTVAIAFGEINPESTATTDYIFISTGAWIATGMAALDCGCVWARWRYAKS